MHQVLTDAAQSFATHGFRRHDRHHGKLSISQQKSWSLYRHRSSFVTLWGSQWTKSRVHFFCDNMAVVAVLKTLTSKDTLIMHLLRCLAFYAAHYGFEKESYHIPGMQNVAADAISRNNLTVIPSLIPQVA